MVAVDDKRDIHISKSLSYLLRHGAVKESLPIDNNGYIKLDIILNHNRLKTHKTTHDDILRVVNSNDKKRFDVRVIDGEEYIAATQGHSIQLKQDDSVLTQLVSQDSLPPVLIHGTSIQSTKMIIEKGFISRMKRNHIHLSPGVVGVDSNVISGMRKQSSIFIYLKRNEILNHIKLFKSLNNVYLTADDIPIGLFEKILIRNKNPDQDLIRLLTEKNIKYEIQTIED